jgi:hypothetical protein
VINNLQGTQNHSDKTSNVRACNYTALTGTLSTYILAPVLPLPLLILAVFSSNWISCSIK